MTTRYAHLPSPLGPLTLVAEGEALAAVYFPEHRAAPAIEDLGSRVELDSDPLFSAVSGELHRYFEGELTVFSIPLATQGDAFQEKVWALLREIPYGEKTTYGAIARELGNPGLAQRVGQAVGRNPLSIIVPCHRVVAADGQLTGFAGGLERKRHLLELEEPAAISAERLF